MFFYVYTLESTESKEWYIGYTKNLRERFKEHARGESRSTKSKRPWNLIYYEACLYEDDARRRERYLKTSQGRKMLRRRLYCHVCDSPQ